MNVVPQNYESFLATFPRVEFQHTFNNRNEFSVVEPTADSTEVSIGRNGIKLYDFSNDFLPGDWRMLTLGSAEDYFDQLGFKTNVKPWSTYTEYDGIQINTIVMGPFEEEDGGMRKLLTIFHERAHVLRRSDYMRRRVRVKDEQDSLRMIQAWEEVGAWIDAVPDFLDMCKIAGISVSEIFPNSDDAKNYIYSYLDSSFQGLWEVYKPKLDRQINKLFV